MIIACDVDDVICGLMPVWLKYYNLDYFDNLRPEDIKTWNIQDFVKPECGNRIREYLNTGFLYNFALPINGALDGINLIRSAGNRIVFATSAFNGHAGRKFKWLQDYGFLDSGVEFSKDYMEVSDKSLIRADVLIDDGVHNLLGFHGKRIQFLQPWNIQECVPGAWIAISWDIIPSIIEEIEREYRF